MGLTRTARAEAAEAALHLHDEVLWHDVECGAYTADLGLWRALAAERVPGPVLDLGCGAGRVALDLARRGREVVGADLRAPLVDALRSRASREALPVRAVVADARHLDLGERFPLVLAPMQLVQLLDAAGRGGMLAAIARHLEPGGLAALTVADAALGTAPQDMLPDVRERDGWVHSSLPLAIREEAAGILALERLRQVVSPAGHIAEERTVVRLHRLEPERVEDEARQSGLTPAGRRRTPPTSLHVGSTAVLLEGSR